MSVKLVNHQKSSDHLASFRAWKELELGLKKIKLLTKTICV